MLVEIITIFFVLIFAHAVGDFAIQSDKMAILKNPNNMPASFAGMLSNEWWVWFLSAHAIIHGGLVFMATQSLLIGVLEVVVHWIVDLLKCKKFLTIKTDQYLHIISKVIWSVMYINLK